MSVRTLFSEVKVGSYVLGHRVVMAPMTRMRANPDSTVSDMMVEYYAQRASQGGLLIMEGSFVSETGNAFQGSPAIYDDRFIPGFARIANAVHAKSGRIFAQLYHAGRASHADLQPNGEHPVAPTALAFSGHAYMQYGQVPATPARALRLDEMPRLIEDFRLAAKRVKAAGFDGVEIHLANGYLLNQFLEDVSNKRADRYGGSVENRTRLPLEVLASAVSAWDRGKVGVRISPGGTFNEMGDSDPDTLFKYLAARLGEFDLAYLHVVEPRISGASSRGEGGKKQSSASRQLRSAYSGTIIASGGFDREEAEATLQRGDADLVAFGRDFISNPDLPKRLRTGLPLAAYDQSRFYAGGSDGYLDYPFHTD